MSRQFQVFVGFDPRQPVAERVATHSLISNASKPLSVTRLQLNQLPITRRGLTEFTYSRFLVPYLSEFDGYSLFMDADMIVLGDIWELLPVQDPLAAVSVVMHKDKFERPSLMLFNNKRCRNLTPAFVEDAKNPMFDMAWASRIGSLPPEWNHLVGYDAEDPAAKLVHFTKGIPCWEQTHDCEYATQWRNFFNQTQSTVPFQELMGASVHTYHPRAS